MNNNAMRKEVMNAVAVLTRLADALAKPPEPTSRIGQWFVDAAYPTRWYGPVTMQDKDGAWEGEQCYAPAYSWLILESRISDGTYLRIPPRPDDADLAAKGVRLVTPNQVRPWKKGEFFVEDNGAVIQGTWDCDAAHIGDPTGFGFRHWICEPIPAEKPAESVVLSKDRDWLTKQAAMEDYGPVSAGAGPGIALPVRVWLHRVEGWSIEDTNGAPVATGMSNAEAAEIASALNERPFMERMEEWAREHAREFGVTGAGNDLELRESRERRDAALRDLNAVRGVRT